MRDLVVSSKRPLIATVSTTISQSDAKRVLSSSPTRLVSLFRRVENVIKVFDFYSVMNAKYNPSGPGRVTFRCFLLPHLAIALILIKFEERKEKKEKEKKDKEKEKEKDRKTK